MIRLFLSIVCFLSLALSALADDVTIQPIRLDKGDEIIAHVTGVGPLGIESDLRATSSQITLTGTTDVFLGPAQSPGIYNVELTGAVKYSACLLLLPDDQNKFILAVLKRPAKSERLPPENTEVFARFRKGLTLARFEKSAQKVVSTWAANNAVGLGTTLVICLIPGEQIACFTSAGVQVLDLSASILSDMITDMASNQLLSTEEAETLRKVVQRTNLGMQLLPYSSGDPRWFKALDRLFTVVGSEEVKVESPQGKLAMKFSTDFAHKYLFLLRLKP